MQNIDILALAGLRVDGRRADDIRDLKHRLGPISMTVADGSAYFEQGLNKILVAVHGPHEPKRRGNLAGSNDKCVISCRYCNTPFSGIDRKLRRTGDRRAQEVEAVIRQIAEEIIILDLYPKSEITIVIHVLESDGSVICAIMNAVSLALMHAGIAMSDMIAACSAGFVKHNLYIDLNNAEQSAGGAYLPVVIKVNTEEIIYIQQESRLSIDQFESAMKKSIAGCKKVSKYLSEATLDSMITQNR
eukprot:gene14564-19553_t